MGFHDPAHSGRSAEILTPPLTPDWTWKDTIPFDQGSSESGFPGPAFWLPIAYQGKVYLQGGMNANRIFALDPNTGQMLWHTDSPYAASHYIYQFDNYPSAVLGRIISAQTDFTLSMDAETGCCFDSAHSTYNVLGGGPEGGTAAWRGLGYFQYPRWDERNETFWIQPDPVNWVNIYSYSNPNNTTTFFDSTLRVPAVANNLTFASFMQQIVGQTATDNLPIWTWGSHCLGASVSIWRDTAYVGCLGNLVALDAATGAQKWSVPFTAAFSGAGLNPIVSDGVVYLGAYDKSFYALDATTGAVKWSFAAGSPFTAFQIPALSGNVIYVPSADGHLYALDNRTGALLNTVTSSSPWGPVIISGGRLFAATMNDWVFHAFKPAAAALGPRIDAISPVAADNDKPATVQISGIGFVQVQSVSLGQTILQFSTGTVQRLTATIPAGVNPGTYRLKIQTATGTTYDEPPFQVLPAGQTLINPLGTSKDGYNQSGTEQTFQRHIAKMTDGTLVAVYIGPVSDYVKITYNLSHDGGNTWTAQTRLPVENPGTNVNNGALTTSVWTDNQNNVYVSYDRWNYPALFQAVGRYTVKGQLLFEAPGFPVVIDPAFPDFPGTGIADRNNRQWLVNTDYAAHGLYAYYSDDAGITWQKQGPLNAGAASSPDLILYQGKPAVIYGDAGLLSWILWNGSDWTPAVPLPGNLPAAAFHSAAVTDDQKMHIVFQAGTAIQYLAFDGAAWSAVQTIETTGAAPSLTTDGSDLWCFYSDAGSNLVYRKMHGSTWGTANAITRDGNHNAQAAAPIRIVGSIPVIWTSGTIEPAWTVLQTSIPAN